VSVVFGYLHGILFISLHCMGCWEESLLFRGWSPGEGPMGDRPVHTPDPLRSRSSLLRISFTEIGMHSVMSLYCFTGHLVVLCAQTSRHCRPGRALCSWMKKSARWFCFACIGALRFHALMSFMDAGFCCSANQHFAYFSTTSKYVFFKEQIIN
jgi:hypothetical protein